MMKTTAQLQTDRSSHRSAAESNRPFRETRGSAILDNRPEAVAQRRLAEAIHNSPSMVAQRRQFRGLFGEAAQLKGGPEEEELLQKKVAPVQRQGPEDEDLLQGKFEVRQRKGLEEEEPLQGKFEGISSTQLKEKAPKPNASTELSTGDTGLPDNLKSGIESLSGLSMDNVSVHYNSSQPARLNALAYTQGTDIHVAPGQEQHLPHEAWHVVQQAQGRVQPTMQMKDGVPVNDDQGLEHEADVMGAKAMGYAVQRQAPAEEELLQGKRDSVQRQGAEEEELLQGKITRQDRTGRLIQRMAENDNAPVFKDGAQVDPTETLVIRGGDIPHGINATLIESLPRNNGLKKGNGKSTPTWPIGTWTGISVVSCTKHVEGKKAMVVIHVPPGLEIIQCDNDHHAEFKTTVAMSTTDLNKAIKGIKTTGTGDGSVAQLKDMRGVWLTASSDKR